MNIKFSYMYRDYANYKQSNEIVFANPSNVLLTEVERIIKKHLIGGQWFYAKHWEVPDLHFKDWDNEIDGPVHEYISVEETHKISNIEFTLDQFLNIIKKAKNTWMF